MIYLVVAQPRYGEGGKSRKLFSVLSGKQILVVFGVEYASEGGEEVHAH